MKLKPGPAVWDRKIPHVPLKSPYEKLVLRVILGHLPGKLLANQVIQRLKNDLR